MKKSQLRKIIRESIKEMMTEQQRGKETNYSGIDGSSGVTLIPPKSRELQLREQGNTPCTNGAYMTLEACPNSYHWTGTYMAGPWHCYCCTINGNLPTQADVNTTIDFGPLNSSMGPNSFKVLTVSPGNPSNWQGSMNATSACCVPAVQTMQGGCITPPSGCQPTNAFPNNFNLSSWTTTWTSLPNFSSSNPNQPCNFVCQRRNQWTAQLAAGGMGPNWTNMMECKLAEANNQYQIHNCATSNANNCP